MALSEKQSLFLPQIAQRKNAVATHAGNASSLDEMGFRSDDALDLKLIKYFDKTDAAIGDVPLYFIEVIPKNFLEGRLDETEETKITCPRIMTKFEDWYAVHGEITPAIRAGIDLPKFERS